MDIFSIMNVITTQHHRCRANIPINTSVTMNVLTMQRCKRCTFDSPGLASESEGYPVFALARTTPVGVVPFILCRFIAAFHAEKARHLTALTSSLHA